jgi:hypothetical protein
MTWLGAAYKDQLAAAAELDRLRAERAERQAETDRIRAATLAQHEANLAAAHPSVRPFLLLHAPALDITGRRAECHGCDFSGDEAESPEWPCRTYELAVQDHSADVEDRN